MESIHQLVLNAENLVREEVFLQQRVQHEQQQLTLERRHHSHPQRASEAYNRQSSWPVVLTTKRSSKCNGGSNYLSEAAAGFAAMKATNSMPKKLPSDGSSSSARKCDQLKIKFVQVRSSFGSCEVRPFTQYLIVAVFCTFGVVDFESGSAAINEQQYKLVFSGRTVGMTVFDSFTGMATAATTGTDGIAGNALQCGHRL